MTKSQRQHGIASLKPGEKIVGKPGGLVEPGVKQYGIFKKIKNVAKKVFKSPLGKAALLGAGAWGLGGLGGATGMARFSPSAWKSGLGAIRNKGMATLFGNVGGPGNMYGKPGIFSGAKKGLGKFGWGKAALLGGGALATALPFMGGDEEDEDIIDDWSITPSSISKIRDMARKRDSSLAFMPPSDYVQSGFFTGAKDGGIIGLANGGNPAEAQVEQMLKMEYQKYRNQGGTLSYPEFKMQVMQQAQQSQGSGAQGQPQMAAYGGRMGYENGELVEDESMVEETPEGMMEENVEEVQGEPTREQMEALAMEIFQLRLEELDEEQLMVVYQAAMEQQPEEMAMQEEIEFNPQMAQGQPQMDPRQMAAEGGIMNLGGMEKDYRAEGGFVPIGGKEKADDVPARLSKNEFVFTADAVRNAGGGDIDAGAEVMENMMNNLEAGGQISEESQGGGGEEMISEEEISEGPNGAQEMYDQQQMLQSRMA